MKLFLDSNLFFCVLGFLKVCIFMKLTGKIRLKCKYDCNLQPSCPIFHSLLLNLMLHIWEMKPRENLENVKVTQQMWTDNSNVPLQSDLSFSFCFLSGVPDSASLNCRNMKREKFFVILLRKMIAVQFRGSLQWCEWPGPQFLKHSISNMVQLSRKMHRNGTQWLTFI